MIRWGWRLFRREWRQQLLVLALIMVAVGATVVGAAVAVSTPPPANAGFGTASDLATFSGSDPHLAAGIAALAAKYGRTDVIENQALTVPGSIDKYDPARPEPGRRVRAADAFAAQRALPGRAGSGGADAGPGRQPGPIHPMTSGGTPGRPAR